MGLTEIPLTVKKGDTILYNKNAGTELKHKENSYLIMRESEILVILKK